MRPDLYDNTITTIDLVKFDLHNPDSQHIVEWMPDTGVQVLAQFVTECCSLSGEVVQSLPDGVTDTTPVTYLSCPWWYFDGWTCDNGYSTSDAEISLSGVFNDVICTAHGHIATHTVDFTIASYYSDGILTGTTHQVVIHGGDCSCVTAVPNLGHTFSHWNYKENSWGYEVFYSYNPTICPVNITADETYIAYFT